MPPELDSRTLTPQFMYFDACHLETNLQRGSPGDPVVSPEGPRAQPGAAAGGRDARETAGELFWDALSESMG